MKQIYRSTNERIIGGVAGGMADYLDLDVVLVRLLWVFFAFMGVGIPVYIVAWIIIPAEPYSGAGRYYKGTGSVDREAAAGSDENEGFEENDTDDKKGFPGERDCSIQDQSGDWHIPCNRWNSLFNKRNVSNGHFSICLACFAGTPGRVHPL